MSEMADIASVFQSQSNIAAEHELDISERAKVDTVSQTTQFITEGDDSVFYSQEEKIPHQVLDSIWAPRSGEPIWPDSLHSAGQINISQTHAACHGIELTDASAEHDRVSILEEMENKVDNNVKNESSTDADVDDETEANSREITHAEELSTPPAVPLRGSTPAEAAQMKEKDESSFIFPDGSGETGQTGESSVSMGEVQQEHGLDLTCDSDHKPFNHLTYAKYGTVSYRKIERGQTRKKIEMFESMMQI